MGSSVQPFSSSLYLFFFFIFLVFNHDTPSVLVCMDFTNVLVLQGRHYLRQYGVYRNYALFGLHKQLIQCSNSYNLGFRLLTS